MVTEMTKNDLAQKLAEKFNISQKNARTVVDVIFENILCSVILEDNLILRGFGTFMVKVAKPCKRRNPQTGASVMVGERRSFVFKAGKALLARMNKETKE
jgi:nucleoid DNA-binding protein